MAWGVPLEERHGAAFPLQRHNGAIAADLLIFNMLDRLIPPSGPFSWLDVGCGTGMHIRYARERNRQLTAYGVELQPNVAHLARQIMEQCGLADTVTIESAGYSRFWVTAAPRPGQPA